MNIEEILDMVDDLLDKSLSLPLSGGRSLVDDDKIRELLNDIRQNLPGEIKQARDIVADRAEILSSAKREADSLIRRAEDRARALIAQETIVKQAQAKANEILTQAQNKSKEMRIASTEFAEDVLRRSEESMTKLLGDLRETRQAVKESARNQR